MRGGGNHDDSARFKMLFSQSGVHILFDGTDRKLTATLQEDFLDLWTEDVSICFFWTDEKHSIDFEYEISPLGYELPILVPNMDGRFRGWRPWHDKDERRIQKQVSATVTVHSPASCDAVMEGVRHIFRSTSCGNRGICGRKMSQTPTRERLPATGGANESMTAVSGWRAEVFDYYNQQATQWDWSRVGPSLHEIKSLGAGIASSTVRS